MYVPRNRPFSSAVAAIVFAATLTLSAVAPDAVQARGADAHQSAKLPSFQ